MKSQKIWELSRWFEDYFEKQLIQSMWQSNFVPSFDNYFKTQYKSRDELILKAEDVRREIKRLRSL